VFLDADGLEGPRDLAVWGERFLEVDVSEEQHLARLHAQRSMD
jgi:hypothetical protein